MTSYERIRAAVSHEQPDRVPCDFAADPVMVEVGVTILDPIQTTAFGMDTAGLKRDFGDRLTFHGAIDIQQLLPNGTVDEVRAFVREAMATLNRDGGYILGPTHAIQQDTPLQSIAAMYEEAQDRRML